MKLASRLRQLLCFLGVLMLGPAPACAQFSKLSDLSAEFAKKLKHENPQMVAVADFTSTDGSPSMQGDYFAWLLTTALTVHDKNLPVAEYKAFQDALAKHKITPSDLNAPEGLHQLGAKVNVDFLITGTVELTPGDYRIHVTARRIADGSQLLDKTIVVQRTEFSDSLSEPFPPKVDYPFVKSGQGGGRVDQSFVPRCLYCPQPSYDDLARRKKVQGNSVLEVLISPEGQVAAIHPVKLLGYGLDEQAFNAIKNWKFKPASKPDGTPIAVIVPVEVTFRLY